jgi:hypothetical protein
MIQRLYLWWKFRDETFRSLAESYLILLKSARRCAYDLRHAADAIPAGYYNDIFDERSRSWVKLFAADGIKDYRLEMHRDIDALRREVDALRAELLEHGITSKVRNPRVDPF